MPTLINLLQGRPFILRRIIGMWPGVSRGGFPLSEKPVYQELAPQTPHKSSRFIFLGSILSFQAKVDSDGRVHLGGNAFEQSRPILPL